MTKARLNFEIIPVFNQATANVWNDFIKIEAACDKAIYDLSGPSKSTIQTRLREYKSNLHEYKHNFAFVAYYRKHIIGFAYGFSISSYEMYLNRLYVSPKYHRCGVGSQLLKATEQSATMVAKKLSLIALANAADFYQQKHGYDQFEYMEKYLEPTANSIMPVFQWVKKDFHVKIDVPVDTMVLKQSKYQPIFAHINDDYEIDAVATRTNDGTNKIWVTQQSKQYRAELLKALTKTK